MWCHYKFAPFLSCWVETGSTALQHNRLTFKPREIKADESGWCHLCAQRIISGNEGNDSLPAAFLSKPGATSLRNWQNLIPLWPRAPSDEQLVVRGGKSSYGKDPRWHCGGRGGGIVTSPRMYSQTRIAVRGCHKQSTLSVWLLNFPKNTYRILKRASQNH